MTNQNKAYLYAIFVVLFWSTIGAAFKLTLDYVNFDELVFYSTLVSLVFLFITLIVRGQLRLIGSFTLKDYVSSALIGFLNPFLYYLILLKAYSILRAQEVVVLNYLWPVMLVLLSIPLLRQKIGFKSLLAICISFIGSYIVATEGKLLDLKFSDPLGVALAFGSTFIWALYWILNVRDKREEVSKLFLNFVFGFIYILVYTLLFSDIRVLPLEGAIGVCYVGLFEMGLTFVFWLKALRLSSTTAKVTNLIYITPFISLLIINLTVGEKIIPTTLIGLFFIIGGIVLQRVSGRKVVGSR